MSDSAGWSTPDRPSPTDPYATPVDGAGYPSVGHPAPGYAPTGYAPTGYAPTGYAPTGYAPTGYAPTGYTPGGYPAPGYAQVAPPPPGDVPAGHPPRLRAVSGLGVAVLTVAALWLLMDLLEALTAFSAAPRFAAAAEQGLPQPFVGYDGVVMLSTLTQLAALVLTGLWLTAVHGNVRAVAPGAQRRGVVWAWLGWLVPVVSLWFPYQVVADAGRASTRARLGYGLWWGLFLAFLVAQQVTTAMVGGLGGDVDPAFVRWLPLAETASALLLLATGVLWARIVLRVGAAQTQWVSARRGGGWA